MIHRRGLLIGLAALPFAARAAELMAMPGEDRIAFDILRDEDVIGFHRLGFVPREDGFDVAIEVEITVSFGPIALYRYRHHGHEEWRGGTLAHAEATTDDDGTACAMRCDRHDGPLWVTGSKTEPYQAPAEARLATHWNQAELDGPWINPQDGRLFRPVVTRRGQDRVSLPDGSVRTADHFALTGDVHLDLWYDSDRRWTALGFTAKDSSQIRYRRA